MKYVWWMYMYVGGGELVMVMVERGGRGRGENVTKMKNRFTINNYYTVNKKGWELVVFILLYVGHQF